MGTALLLLVTQMDAPSGSTLPPPWAGSCVAHAICACSARTTEVIAGAVKRGLFVCLRFELPFMAFCIAVWGAHHVFLVVFVTSEVLKSLPAAVLTCDSCKTISPFDCFCSPMCQCRATDKWFIVSRASLEFMHTAKNSFYFFTPFSPASHPPPYSLATVLSFGPLCASEVGGK